MKFRSWDDIETHYLELNEHGWKHDKLIELIRHIKSTELSKRIYATTSVDRLLVSIYEDIEMNKETLQINFDRIKQQWHFDYFANPYVEPEFSRVYPAEKGIEKFDNFIKMIGW
jgi:hypothetical protein